MRLTREYAFDMIEMVGKAVVTARKKAVTMRDIDGLVPPWLKDILRRSRPEPSPGQDEFGLFGESPWAAQYESDSERTDLASVVPGAEDFQTSPVERKMIQREWDSYGDSIACELWQIQRKLRFKTVGVQDTLKDLQALCYRIRSFISKGWANRLAQIIDACSRG